MLLGIFQMSCSKSTEARVDHITRILGRAIEDLCSNIPTMVEKCRDMILKDIVTTLSCPELQDQFDRRAKRELEDLATMVYIASHRDLVKKKGTDPFYNSYDSFSDENQGEYQQKKRGINVDVNAAILSSVTPTMESVFRNAIEETPKSFEAQAAQTIRLGFNGLNKILKDDPQALAGDGYQLCFGNHLAGFNKNVGIKVEAATKRLCRGLIEVGNKAFKSTEKRYSHQVIVPIYEQAEAERPQKRQRLMDVRHDYLVENIPGLEGPFPKIAECTDKDAREVIHHTCRKLPYQRGQLSRGNSRSIRTPEEQENKMIRPRASVSARSWHDLVAEALMGLKGVETESLQQCKKQSMRDET